MAPNETTIGRFHKRGRIRSTGVGVADFVVPKGPGMEPNWVLLY